MRRLELHLTYTCPERCGFCSEEHRMKAYSAFPVTFARAATVLRTEAARGVQAVHFTGGEPTIHPRFVDLLVLARKLGLRTSIGTIGTRLADAAFAARVMPWLDEALFSLHGPDAATHDAATGRPGSFDRLCAAVENAKAHPGFRPFFNTVVTSATLPHLLATTRLARALGGALLVVSNVTPEGQAEDDYATLAAPLTRLGESVEAVIKAAGPMIVRFFGTPACVLGAHRMASNDLHWNPRVTWEWIRHPDRVSFAPIYSWDPRRKRTYTETCGRCGWKGLCAGVFAAYAERWGEAELHPLEAA